ncbi:MAG: NUDIX domain-containing protein [Candidatus Moranbacteria bacterium]|nr:NUDIX domain-containing protein [Candidatus Moranbacteria bacterium]
MLKNHGVAVLIRDKDKFLLLKDSRKLMLDFWAPPHGRCEEADKNENNTVKRETFEETNLRVKPVKKVWTTEADTKTKTISFWLAEIIDGEICLDKDESSEYGWFTLEEALKLKLYPGTERFFTLVKKGSILI